MEEPEMEPGNPDSQQPCLAYAAPEEHELSALVAFGNPHPVGFTCSCGETLEVSS